MKISRLLGNGVLLEPVAQSFKNTLQLGTEISERSCYRRTSHNWSWQWIFQSTNQSSDILLWVLRLLRLLRPKVVETKHYFYESVELVEYKLKIFGKNAGHYIRGMLSPSPPNAKKLNCWFQSFVVVELNPITPVE